MTHVEVLAACCAFAVVVRLAATAHELMSEWRFVRANSCHARGDAIALAFSTKKIGA